MQIKTHARLLIAAQIIAFLPPILLWVRIIDTAPIWLQLVVMVPLFLLAAIAPFWIFGRFVAARCPRPACGGETYPAFPKAPENRLVYTCRRCARTADSSVRYDGLSID